MIVAGELYTTKELAKEYSLSMRTVHNRLKFLRYKYPDCYIREKLPNGLPLLKYKGEYLNDDMLRKRHYPERRAFTRSLTKAEREYVPPPVFVKDKEGNEYNYHAVRALLRVLTNSSLLEKFMALNMVLWLGLLTYMWLL